MKPPLAIFSPLPPIKSGTADYCFEQLEHLAEAWDLTVVVERDARKVLEVPDGVRVEDVKSWQRDGRRDAETPRLYHVGNNIHHEYVFEEILRRPGIVLVHDFALHHLIVEMTLARGNQRRYRELLAHDYGALGARVAAQRAEYVFTEYQQFLMPANGTVLGRATGVIVHSRWAERRVRHAYPKTPVLHVPHHYSPPDEGTLEPDVAAARRSLGMSEDKLVYMAIGFVTPPKRVDLTIRALAAIRDRLPPFEFWLVGECRDPEALDAELKRCGMSDVVRTTGYVPLDRFQVAIQAADVIVNLRYPTAGETSGTLVRALGMGRPVVVFDYGSFADVPSWAAEKIPLETQETERLQEALLRLGLDPAHRERLGCRAADHVGTRYAMTRCAREYTRFIRQVLARN